MGLGAILGHADWHAGGAGRGAVVLAEQMFAGPCAGVRLLPRRDRMVTVLPLMLVKTVILWG
jgi:hypothetical protein